jgi:hypothetical protein
LPVASQPRDEILIECEEQIRMAIRDAVNRNSRKPFDWGGLTGYMQMEAIEPALDLMLAANPESQYLQRLSLQVKRVLEQNRDLKIDLQAAHQWLEHIADCLHYPPKPKCSDPTQLVTPSSQQIAQEMQQLIAQFEPEAKLQPVQTALKDALVRIWKTCGKELLHCYDIPGLPPDNLKLESFFGKLRCHQRRISGRKSTRELRNFGQYQILCLAESQAELLEQIQKVPLADYQFHRKRLAENEVPRQFFYRLHRDPLQTMQNLAEKYIAHLPAGQAVYPLFAMPVLENIPLHTI